MALSVESTLVFSSIMFLVVIELSGRTNGEDLADIIKISNDRILGGFENLGRFTIVHTFNSFILMTGYLVLFIQRMENSNIVITLVLLLSAGFLWILPYLELDDIGTISGSTDHVLGSMQIHTIYTVFVILVTPLIFSTAALFGNMGGIPMKELTSLLFTIGFFTLLTIFFRRLRQEIVSEVRLKM